MVSVIIPAFEEEKTIREAILSAQGHPLVGEIIVVDDGSTDRTYKEALSTGVRAVRLTENLGKAGAMSYGVRLARHDTILFLDADILGVTHDMITQIVTPVLEGKHEMYVGMRARKIFWLNKTLRFLPIIGGERALTRNLWDSVPEIYKHRFQIEIALNYFAKKTSRGMGALLIRGVRHVTKEMKHGLWLGLWRRTRMIYNCISIGIQLYVFYNLHLSYQALLDTSAVIWEEIIGKE